MYLIAFFLSEYDVHGNVRLRSVCYLSRSFGMSLLMSPNYARERRLPVAIPAILSLLAPTSHCPLYKPLRIPFKAIRNPLSDCIAMFETFSTHRPSAVSHHVTPVNFCLVYTQGIHSKPLTLQSFVRSTTDTSFALQNKRILKRAQTTFTKLLSIDLEFQRKRFTSALKRA